MFVQQAHESQQKKSPPPLLLPRVINNPAGYEVAEKLLSQAHPSAACRQEKASLPLPSLQEGRRAARGWLRLHKKLSFRFQGERCQAAAESPLLHRELLV